MALSARWTSWLEVGLMCLLGVVSGPRAALRVFVSVAAIYLMAEGLGRLVPRHRPFARSDDVEHLVGHAERRSFPSRHVASALAMAVVAGRAHAAIGKSMAALAALLAVSRVAAGLHYPSDVAAGAALGLTVGRLVRRL